jgi:hypothetical protein
MGRPRTRQPRAGESLTLSFRVDGAVAQALDHEAAHIMAAHPGIQVTRVDVVRAVLAEWMKKRR